ncbi:histidine phosphatase family protein [Cupriavidus gilardii]|uniref:phosphoglycerate mutase (2,3-diphosphoglycerate-dependent) n=1 Tax=Cupriavidus gilardii TaxID=82541 RepID=A0ABY4VQP7_9BURK|nr:histidine phosphatase family protein [Cupriavidus gilardii]QQE07362.1 histidine phosphatase family protein [Cupriavidus sp. ISTL7]MCT9070983.1 phosphoglycerate mutase family protein [Cupriavidus gilardii]MCT9125300.1 phosphoglycerate mutase family protein [Cupriavidus gilardii]QKS62899.1 histidine phosphatase family protein [Cupriavidus gilardii]USE79584.1 phosphoglycerate mutase family protein [Cupriavidus gilardii]
MMLYLVRHGRSVANDAGLVTGTTADELDAIGVAQAQRMAAWLSHAGIVADRYMTSQWCRAQQTARLLMPAADWEVDSRLGETDAGEVADWQLARFLAQCPDFYADPGNRYPGGESHLALNQRVLGWLDEQLARPVDALMVVAHSGPISCILQHIHGVGMERFPAFLPAHASLSAIEMVRGDDAWHGRLLAFALGPLENLPVAIHGARGRAAS